MRRITEPSADQNLFGPGRAGFTDGNPVTFVGTTELNADWFNNSQEALARCIEGDGQTIVAPAATPDYHQLDNAMQRAAVRGVCTSVTADYVLRGLTFTLDGASLGVIFTGGEFVWNGRRFVVNSTKLTAAVAALIPLVANQDRYYYLAPDNPADVPQSLEQFYIVAADVANDAAAPVTPTGTMLFAVVTSNGVGSTAVQYHNRGPRMVAETGGTVALRPLLGSLDGRTALHREPSVLVDLGYPGQDSNLGYWGDAYVQRQHIRSLANSLHSLADNMRETEFATTAPATDVESNLLNSAIWPNGTIAYIEIKGVARCSSDPTINAYGFRKEFVVYLASGTWNLDATGGAASFGNTPAGGVAINVSIVGANVVLGLTAHATETMRWFYEIHTIISGD